MQTESGQQSGNPSLTPALSRRPPNVDAPPDIDEDTRKAEEYRMLLVGFATGLTIAGIFLVYIVFEAARLLP